MTYIRSRPRWAQRTLGGVESKAREGEDKSGWRGGMGGGLAQKKTEKKKKSFKKVLFCHSVVTLVEDLLKP